jgi:hypothetical protein
MTEGLIEKHTPTDQACLLVGRFLFHFSDIEAELNDALRKLFELHPDSADTVCANIDFFRKVHIVRSALTDQDVDGAQAQQIKAMFAKVGYFNDHRLVVAHAPFEANGDDGIKFKRTLAKTGLSREAPVWTAGYCARLYTEMVALKTDLHMMVQSVAPYHPTLDFSDPRNSGYLLLLGDL